MFFWDRFLTRGRLPISSFLCFIGGFSMGSWLTLFHQLQLERDLTAADELSSLTHNQPLLLLAILILSAPKNSDLRNTLRNTWLKLNSEQGQAKHFFAIGTLGMESNMLQKLKREQTVEGDILFLPDLQDSYANLTLKLMSSLAQLSESSPYQYVLKVDDDSFARVDALVEELEKREESGTCFYWGFFDGRARVQKKGKWKEQDYDLCDLYIPYALGGGYVLSKRCTDYLIKNRHSLRHFQNEDTSIGTWLGAITHSKKHDVRFDTEYESRGCNNGHLVQHKISQSEMVERYKSLVTRGHLCPKEKRKKPSYNYRFDLPPSQCCARDPNDPNLI